MSGPRRFCKRLKSLFWSIKRIEPHTAFFGIDHRIGLCTDGEGAGAGEETDRPAIDSPVREPAPSTVPIFRFSTSGIIIIGAAQSHRLQCRSIDTSQRMPRVLLNHLSLDSRDPQSTLFMYEKKSIYTFTVSVYWYPRRRDLKTEAIIAPLEDDLR